MFVALGHFALARRWLIVVASVVVLAAAVLVIRRGGALSSGATDGIEADVAQRLIERELAFPGDSSFMILFHGRGFAASDPRFTDALRAALAPLRADARVRAVLAPDDAPPPMAERLVSSERVPFQVLVPLTLRSPTAPALDSPKPLMSSCSAATLTPASSRVPP